jgi:hypothetical protein
MVDQKRSLNWRILFTVHFVNDRSVSCLSNAMARVKCRSFHAPDLIHFDTVPVGAVSNRTQYLAPNVNHGLTQIYKINKLTSFRWQLPENI